MTSEPQFNAVDALVDNSSQPTKGVARPSKRSPQHKLAEANCDRVSR